MIPISLVGRNPSVIPNSVCRILVAENKQATEQQSVKIADAPSDSPGEESQNISGIQFFICDIV